VTTFRSPRYPALAIRTTERYFKFAGGQLEVAGADADLVRDWITVHPAYGVTEAKTVKRAKADQPPIESPPEPSPDEDVGT
jgi:hypothetical protein